MSVMEARGEQQQQEEATLTMELRKSNWPLLLLETLNNFRRQGAGCDVVLVSEDNETLEVHSLLLKAASPYFQQVLDASEASQARVVMQLASPGATLAQMVDFLYTGRTLVPLSDVAVLQQMARDFSLEVLEALCQQTGLGAVKPEVAAETQQTLKQESAAETTMEDDATLQEAAEVTEEPIGDSNDAIFHQAEDQTEVVTTEDTHLLAQVSQGEIHLIQQEGGLAFSVEGEVSPSDGGEQVVTNLDMLSFEMQSLEPAPAKQKPFKVYRYKCGYCDKTFSHKYRLKGHQATAHFGKKAHKCHLCDKSYTQVEYLREHMATHNAEKNFECRVCKKKFQTMRVMKHHEKIHGYRVEEKFKCEICSKVLSSKNHLQKHLVSHTGVKHYKCDQCEKSFMYAEGLHKHKQQHALGSLRACSTCKQTFASYKLLKEHVTDEHPAEPKLHECDICRKSFSSEGWLNKHVVDVHAEDGRATFRCVTCGVDFTSETLLKAHREVEHADDAARLREEEAAEAPPGGSGGGEALHVYPCSQCSKIFKRKYALKEHVRTHTGEKPHVCHYCSKAFTSSSNLRKHERLLHESAAPQNVLMTGKEEKSDVLVRIYKCGLCADTFSEPGELESHVAQHQTGSGNKTFSSKHSLKEQLSVEPSRVRYVCDVCRQQFSVQRQLAAHLAKVHNVTGNQLRDKLLGAIHIQHKLSAGTEDVDSKAAAHPDSGKKEIEESEDSFQVLHVREMGDGTLVLENASGQLLDPKEFETATVSVEGEPLVFVSDSV